MTDFLAKIRDRASRLGATIVLPEGDDERILAAAEKAASLGICHPLVIAPAGTVLGHGVERADPENDPDLEDLEQRLVERLRARGLSAAAPEAARRVRDPLYSAALLVDAGRADGAVMGARATTADTLRAAPEPSGRDLACKRSRLVS